MLESSSSGVDGFYSLDPVSVGVPGVRDVNNKGEALIS